MAESIDIPMALITTVLLLLPPDVLIRMMTVCKAWMYLIRDPIFVKLYWENAVSRGDHHIMYLSIYDEVANFQSFNLLDRETFELDSRLGIPQALNKWNDNVSIIGSCNGVICFSLLNRFGFDLFLCNPSIWKYRRVPYSGMNVKIAETVALGFAYHSRVNDFKIVKIAETVALGFAYHSRVNDFKIVRVVQGFFRDVYISPNVHSHDVQVEIYSMISNSWREVQVGSFPRFIVTPTTEVLVAESLHWKVILGDHNEGNSVIKILAFDLREEVFNEILLPPDSSKIERLLDRGFFGVFRSALAVLTYYPDNEGVYLGEVHDLWVMQEYRNPDSWTRLYTINFEIGILRPLMFTVNEKIVFLDAEGYVFAYDCDTRHITYPGVEMPDHSDLFTFTKSLVLINEPIQAP